MTYQTKTNDFAILRFYGFAIKGKDERLKRKVERLIKAKAKTEVKVEVEQKSSIKQDF